MRHRFDVISLVLGLLFGAVAVAALNGWLVDLVFGPGRWTPEVAVATASIVLGLVLLAVVAAVLARRRTFDRAVGDPPVGSEQAVDDGTDDPVPDPSGRHVDA